MRGKDNELIVQHHKEGKYTTAYQKFKMQLYGLLINYINEQKEIDDWAQLTGEQQQGIYNAIAEIDSGKGIPHEKVMSKVRDNYSNV